MKLTPEQFNTIRQVIEANEAELILKTANIESLTTQLELEKASAEKLKNEIQVFKETIFGYEAAPIEKTPPSAESEPEASKSNGDDNNPQWKIGDAVFDILSKAKEPLHLDKVMEEITKYGITTTRGSVSTAVYKDTQKRFVKSGTGFYSLAPADSEEDSAADVSNNNDEPEEKPKRLTELGFKLSEAVKELLREKDFNYEITQPIVFKELISRHPQITASLTDSAVSTTLRNLVAQDLLVVVDENPPKKYKKSKEGSIQQQPLQMALVSEVNT